jgi:hypothetical protein
MLLTSQKISQREDIDIQQAVPIEVDSIRSPAAMPNPDHPRRLSNVGKRTIAVIPP